MIRNIHAVGINGVRVDITQIDEAEVEDRIEGQYSLKFYNNEYKRAVNLAKEGKWSEAKQVLDPKFEAVIPTGF